MRYLSPSDIRQALSYEEMMAAVEEAFLLFAQGQCAMADRSALHPGADHPGHHALLCRGICRHQAHRLQPGQRPPGAPLPLWHRAAQPGDTGQPVALLEGNTLTALRTGAIGGLAARHLAPEGAASAGLVGCGVQGLHQLAFLCQVRPIHTVYLYNHGSKDLGPFCRQLEAMAAPKTFTIELCPDPDTLLTKSDIVVTATPATAPLFADDPAPFRGKCLIAIGSWQPEMREIPEAIWQATQEVFLELPFACQESGDLSQPLASGALKPEGLRYFGDYLLAKGAGSPPASHTPGISNPWAWRCSTPSPPGTSTWPPGKRAWARSWTDPPHPPAGPRQKSARISRNF